MPPNLHVNWNFYCLWRPRLVWGFKGIQPLFRKVPKYQIVMRKWWNERLPRIYIKWSIGFDERRTSLAEVTTSGTGCSAWLPCFLLRRRAALYSRDSRTRPAWPLARRINYAYATPVTLFNIPSKICTTLARVSNFLYNFLHIGRQRFSENWWFCSTNWIGLRWCNEFIRATTEEFPYAMGKDAIGMGMIN